MDEMKDKTEEEKNKRVEKNVQTKNLSKDKS